MEVKHCMKCGEEIWGNRIFEIKGCGEGSAALCPICAKEEALEVLGRVWLVERMTGFCEEEKSDERG